jgi:hypothetical protein
MAPAVPYGHHGGINPVLTSAGFGVPPPRYPHYPQHPAYHVYPQYPWEVSPPIEYVADIQPSDVLSGRG